jgi:hypothetical protein
MAIKAEKSGESVDSFIKLKNDSTANQRWGLLIVLKKPKHLDVLLNYCLSSEWDGTRIHKEYANGKIPVALLDSLLTPP